MWLQLTMLHNKLKLSYIHPVRLPFMVSEKTEGVVLLDLRCGESQECCMVALVEYVLECRMELPYLSE